MSQISSTASWQHIEFCIDALIRIAPSRVLDVGVGHGRWAALIYESQDLWRERRPGRDDAVEIEGITLNNSGLNVVHRQFYRRLHVMPILAAAQAIDARFDVALVEGVLEALSREDGSGLVQRLLAIADYVIVSVDLALRGSHARASPVTSSAQRILWSASDFDTADLRAGQVFHDLSGQPYGVFVLSRSDSRRLADDSILSALDRMESGERSRRRMLSAAKEDLGVARAELAAVVNSRAWRAWTRFRLSRPGRVMAGLRRIVRRGAILGQSAASDVTTAEPEWATASSVGKELVRLGSLPGESWLAIYHPDWPGVAASTVNLFDHTLPLHQVRAADADEIASALLGSGLSRFVFSGFPSGWRELTVALRKMAPGSRLYVLWHGNTTQMVVDVVGDTTHELVQLCRHGVVDRLGFVKEGMSEVFARAGISTAFVMNYLRDPVGQRAAPPTDGRAHIGLLLATVEWRKNNYTQLAAIALLDNGLAYLLPSAPSLERFASQLRLPYVAVSDDRLPRPDAIALMARMHCNLNVTLSECCPMSVLESLSVGTPCLMSATSHLFRDHDYLHSRLCVQYHDNPVEIASRIRQALEERAQIIAAYDAYVPEYSERAQESVRRFLDKE